jgi:hypothetical protein
VLNWSYRRDTDIFSKKSILVSVNKDQHWSLCAVFNAAILNNSVDDVTQEVTFMLFLDPLDYHSRVKMVRNIRNWLNADWNKKHNTCLNIFNNLTMESFLLKHCAFCNQSLTIMLLLLKFPSTFYLFFQHSTTAL